MFGLGKAKAPVEAPFAHEAGCRYAEAQPEWAEDPAWGVERRACVCTSESRPLLSRVLDPATQSPEPARSAHPHLTPTCPGAQTLAAVMVERNERDGGWFSRCSACTSTAYYWRADVWETRDGRDVRVTRAGNVLYVYETADAASARR